ncbi:uncharacterized protein LOC136038158 [Artemia franciscana]|uniref:uncharacterized protein LOC136038158 n=1 Tax=Artemia franciscana TaxID=6661 RepID=UPI0032DB61C8
MKIIVNLIMVATLFKFTPVATFDGKEVYTIEELKKCLHPQFQNSTNCNGNPKAKCYCDTTLDQETDTTASEYCKNLNGEIINKRKNVCRHYLQNSEEYFNVTELFQNCKDKEGAISYGCIGNPKNICKCKSIFLWYVTRREASKICKEGNGLLAGSDKNAETFFEHLSKKNPISQIIKKYTRFNLEENKSTEVDWSKPENRLTDLGEDSASENDQIPFVCEFKITDDLKYLKQSSLDKCKIWDIQYPYGCMGNSQRKCSCMTAFQHPKSKEVAEKYCKEAKGTLASNISIEDLKYIFLGLLKKKRKNICTTPVFYIGDGRYINITWPKSCEANEVAPKINEAKETAEESPFLCEISVTDKLEFLDTDKLKLCQLHQIQKPYNCIGDSNRICPCMTVLLHPKSRVEADKFCKDSNGKFSLGSSYDFQRMLKHILALNGNSIKNHALFFVGDEKYIEVDWSKEPDFAITIKKLPAEMKTTSMAFLCDFPIDDSIDFIDSDKVKQCKNNEIQMVYDCSDKTHGICPCMTAFLKPLPREEASSKCESLSGVPSKTSCNDLKGFLGHLKAENPVNIKEYTRFSFGDDKVGNVDWSNDSEIKVECSTVVTETGSEKSSFICDLPIIPEELKDCNNKTIQTSYNCVGNTRGSCPCMTLFLKPRTREEAAEICKLGGGTLTEPSSGILNYVIERNSEVSNTIKQGNKFIVGGNQYIDVTHAKDEKKITYQNAKSKSNQKQFPFICNLDTKDGKHRVNFEHLKSCENNKTQMHYNCLGNSRKKCPCLTALLFPASNKEAADSCRKADGTLVEGSPSALRKFLKHLQVNNADTITEFTKFTLEGNKQVDIDWSNLDTGVSIKDAENTKDINRRAFICNIPTKDDVNHIDLKDLKSCKIKEIQKLYCSEETNGICTCITAFQQPHSRNEASETCKSMGGELTKGNRTDLEGFFDYLKSENDDSVKDNIKFTVDGNKHVDIEWPEDSNVKIAINDDDADVSNSNFLCNIYIPSEELKACKNEKIQSPYKCVGNTRGKCPCMTAFHLPVYREQATEICKNDGAMLTNGSSSYLKRYFNHLKTKNDETIKNHSQYIIGNNKYVDVDWSKADPTITIQEATTESNKRKMSFLCDYMIEDQPSRISIQELKACENKKIQKRFNCIGNERGKCQCMTAFNHTIPRDDATNICEQLDEGKLNKEFMSSDSEFHIFKKFLRKFRDENGDMIKEQTKFFIGNNKYAVVDWSKDLESGITVKDIPNKTMMTEISSLCVSPIQDNIKFIDYTELKNCGNKKIQKSYECVGNDRENCMCMTALLSQTSRKEAVEICERLDGSLSSASLDTIKRHMLHLKENNDESIKEYTEFIIDSGSYVDVDWSKELETRTTILETKDETKNMAFLCELRVRSNVKS